MAPKKKPEWETLTDWDMGLLNPEGSPLIPPNQFDPKTTKFYANTRAHNQDKYRTNILKNAGPFRAVVLRVDDEGPGGTNSAWGYTKAFFDDSGIKRIKCYVPVLDSFALHPEALGHEGEGEHQAIINNLYESFVFETAGMDTPAEGEHCWVTYGDLESRSDPVYLNKITDSKYETKTKTTKSSREAHAAGTSTPRGRKGSVSAGTKPEDLPAGPDTAEGPFAKIWTPTSVELADGTISKTATNPPVGVSYQITNDDVLIIAKSILMETIGKNRKDMIGEMWGLANRFARGCPNYFADKNSSPCRAVGGKRGGWSSLFDLYVSFSSPLFAGQCAGVSTGRKGRYSATSSEHATKRKICAMNWEQLAAHSEKAKLATNLALEWARGDIECPSDLRQAIDWAASSFTRHQMKNQEPHKRNWRGKDDDRHPHSGHKRAATWKEARFDAKSQGYVSDHWSRQWPEPDGGSWVRLIKPDGSPPTTVSKVKPKEKSTRPYPGTGPIVIFGDSGIAGGLGKALKQYLITKFKLTNKDIFVQGHSGASTGYWLNRRRLTALKKKNPSLVIINLASNDIGKGDHEAAKKFAQNAYQLRLAFGCDVVWMTGPHAPSVYSDGDCTWDSTPAPNTTGAPVCTKDAKFNLLLAAQEIWPIGNHLISATLNGDKNYAMCRDKNTSKGGCHAPMVTRKSQPANPVKVVVSWTKWLHESPLVTKKLPPIIELALKKKQKTLENQVIDEKLRSRRTPVGD